MIAGAKDGPVMGIPGAPETIAPALEPDRAGLDGV